MEKIQPKAYAKVKFNIAFEISVGEAAALDAIAGYGADVFLKKFYSKVGKAYLQPYERDLRELFETIKRELPVQIDMCKKANEAIRTAIKEFK